LLGIVDGRSRIGVEPRGLLQGKRFECKYLLGSDRFLNSWGDLSFFNEAGILINQLYTLFGNFNGL
jgi:hypothetical protein